MTWVAVAVAGAGLIGSSMQADAASSAAGQAAAGQNRALNMNQGMFNTIQSNNQPYMQAGQTSLNQLGQGTQEGGQFNHQFTTQDLQSNLAPNYNWQLQTGLQTNQNMANAQGGIGGNEMVALNNYAQGLAGNSYQNAFNNYNTQQSNIFNRLSSIANLGQNSANAVGQQGTALAGNMGQAAIGAGNAQAAGTIGQANAVSNGLSSAAMWGGMGATGGLGGSNPSSWYQSPQQTGTASSFYSPQGQQDAALLGTH